MDIGYTCFYMKNATDHFHHSAIETKWADLWQRVGLDLTNITDAKRPFYNLLMFPYPSAEGLHVGNMYAFTGSDIYGRFKRMQGYDVFEPIGLDGFGIHSENYAFKIGTHPMDQAAVSEERFYKQLHRIGAMFDWSRTVETYHPDYYRWTQWLFVQMFRNGLAYRRKAEVNWCPSCKTVLADEQVLEGLCERCGNSVSNRLLEQWFFKITAYAEKLLENIPALDWAQKVKIAQEKWIGKKDGINIEYPVLGTKEVITCFTTAPVNFAMTFIVISPQHPLVQKILDGEVHVPEEKRKKIQKYRDTSAKKDKTGQSKEKTGMFTGLSAKNRVADWDVPIWISDFVVAGVGTGAVQGCPGHDLRDFEFAQTFHIPIIRVVKGPDGDVSAIDAPGKVISHGMPGTMVNSKFLDGMEFDAALQKTMDYIEEKGWGKRVVTYHLRDWLISRQRYWGPPIPMIFCESCKKNGKGQRKDMPGWYSVPEKELPVVLPRIDDYKPGDDGVAPLAKHKEFYETKCPGCAGNAVRETDVSDTFLDSSWYFLRYSSVKLDQSVKLAKLPWDAEITKKWLPVHMYTGGAEHSVLHLLYSRFITMALKNMGHISFEEPFTKFFAHGLVIKEGAKMSKSKGNIINPDVYIDKYGIDALRLYLMFMGPYSQGGDFRDAAMEGMSRWVGRVWRMAQKSMHQHSTSSSARVQKELQKAIKKVSEDFENRHYNTAIACMMELTNLVADNGGVMSIEDLKDFIKLLAPLAPFLAEEMYQIIQFRKSKVESRKSEFTKEQSVHLQPWPSYDPALLVEDMVPIVVQINGKLRETLQVQSAKCKVQSEVELAARASEKVVKYLANQTVKKIIFVPGRLINFVI